MNKSVDTNELFESRMGCICMANVNAEYFTGRYKDGDIEVWYKKTPASTIEVSVDGIVRSFQWRVPKIPKFLFEAIKTFFLCVVDAEGTEAMLQILYDLKAGVYQICIPCQTVTETSVAVMSRLDLSEDKCHVMDVYLRNTPKDNDVDGYFFEEKKNGLCCFFDEGASRVRFGVVSGENCIDMSYHEIIEDEQYDANELKEMADQIYETWQEFAAILY